MNCSHSVKVRMAARVDADRGMLEFADGMCSCGALRLIRETETVCWFGWFTPQQLIEFKARWWRQAMKSEAGE